MDSIPYLLAVVVALLGALGLALGRRRPPPAPPVAVASTVAEQHARTVERLEVDVRGDGWKKWGQRTRWARLP